MIIIYNTRVVIAGITSSEVIQIKMLQYFLDNGLLTKSLKYTC